MATPEYETDRGQSDLTLHLDTLRREIGALRQELMESGQVPSTAGDDNYRLATQVDLLVNKFLRLQENLGEKTFRLPGEPLGSGGS